MKIIQNSTKKVKSFDNTKNSETKKLRNQYVFRNLTHLQNYRECDVFKVLPPYEIKGAFLEEGGSESEILYVGFDCEFHFDENKKLDFLTYQLWIENFDEGFFIVSKEGKKISLKDILLLLYNEYKVKNVVFVAHFGVVDFLKLEDYEEFIKYCKINQKTIFGSFKYEFYDESRNKKVFKIKIKDSMLLAGGGSLKNVGKVIGIEKIDIGKNIERMKEFFNENFDKFVEYAMNDAVIAVKFFKYLGNVLEKVFNMDKKEVLSINTASGIGEAFFTKLLEEKNIDNDKFVGRTEIRRVYWSDKFKKLIKFSKVDFDEELKHWEKGYYGGRNETFIQGMYKKAFFDYDVKNAYPLAMLSIQDVDWRERIYLRNDNIHNLEFNDLGFVYLDFEFNEDVKFPMFPIKTDYGLVFVRKGRTIVTITEFLTALKNNMLKDYYIRDGIKFKRKEGLTIPNFIKMVIEERKKYKKGSLENTLWKLVGNSFYGKTAQGLTNKKSLDLRKTIEKGEKEYKKVGKSKITNHFIAGYITGVVRSIVSEYMHYFSKNDILVVNVTTDGFMLDTKLEQEELKGIGYITKKFSSVRKSFLDDDEILELKHFSSEEARNVVIKTRGYWLEPISEKDVVLIARAGIQTKNVEKLYDDDFEKRKAVYKFLTKSWLSADYNAEYLQKNLKNIGDVLVGDVEDIIEFEREVSMNFDYDLKRKPTNFYDEKIEFGGETYVKLKIEDSEAWSNVEEFLTYKRAYEKFDKAKTNVNKIQTKEDMERFFEYVKLEKFADTRVNKLEQVILTKVIHILLLEGWSNAEIANKLNIKVKQVEKRKYSKTFEKVKQRGIKKISEEEFKEVFLPVLKNDFVLDRKFILFLKDKLVDNVSSDEPDLFEVLKKNLNDF